MVAPASTCSASAFSLRHDPRKERESHLLGGFSEYGYVMPEAGRVRVPDNVPNELASLSSCAFRSVMNAMDVLDGIGTTETVVVQGAGPLGLLATAVAKILGARRVITIGAPDARLEMVSELGSDETLSIERTSPEERTERSPTGAGPTS